MVGSHERVDQDILYYEPDGSHSVETRAKNSRFVGTLRRVRNPQEAREALEEEKALRPDASSFIFAYIAGPPASELAGLSDGGEPKGTAGRPVMEVLRGSGLRNAMVTVTRYFGGTKLGTGGLVHAFSDCCRQLLEGAPRRAFRSEKRYRLGLPYDCFEMALRSLEESGAIIEEKHFGTAAEILARIGDRAAPEALEKIRDLSRGRFTVDIDATFP